MSRHCPRCGAAMGMLDALQSPSLEGLQPMVVQRAMTLKAVEWLYPHTRYRLREPLKCEARDRILFEVSGSSGVVTVRRDGYVAGQSLADLEVTLNAEAGKR